MTVTDEPPSSARAWKCSYSAVRRASSHAGVEQGAKRSAVYTGEGEENVEREGMSLRGRKACERLDGFGRLRRRGILDQICSTSYVRGDERGYGQYIHTVSKIGGGGLVEWQKRGKRKVRLKAEGC